MKILVLHNRYRQSGGEDVAASQEVALLRNQGHDVHLLEEDNDGIVDPIEQIKTAVRCVYSRRTYRLVQQTIRNFRPDLVHVHNFFPRFSPAVHYACHDLGVPLVQSLHNFRLACPGGTFFRGREVCNECLGLAVAWPAIRHGCYRESRLASTAVVNMLAIHRALGTWRRMVDVFVALTEFAREKFATAGLPASKIVVKPNFVADDAGVGSGSGGYALFVGRLSPEKGIETLLRAWPRLAVKKQLKIIGYGPMAPMVQEAAKQNPEIKWLRARNHADVLQQMREATVLILPSSCYEGFPVVAAEAFSTGLPIVASDLGSLSEIVSHGETGRLFPAGAPSALAEQMEWIYSHPGHLAAMRKRARQEYESKYAPAHNYQMLMQIYRRAMCGAPGAAAKCRNCEDIR